MSLSNGNKGLKSDMRPATAPGVGLPTPTPEFDSPGNPSRALPSFDPVRWAALYVRLALGAAFLSAVAARFGLWHGRFDPKLFSTDFFKFTGEVLSFVPASWIPAFAVGATVAETALGILLISGLWLRWVSLASSVLLFIFAISMAISLGVESPFDYSVFSASSAALLVSAQAFRQRLNQAHTSLLGVEAFKIQAYRRNSWHRD